jgi:hypothetical protein
MNEDWPPWSARSGLRWASVQRFEVRGWNTEHLEGFVQAMRDLHPALRTCTLPYKTKIT